MSSARSTVRLTWKKRVGKKRRSAIAAEITRRYGYACEHEADTLLLLAAPRDTKPIWLFMMMGNWSAIA